MKAIIKKSITLLAAVSLALPLAPVPVAQAQETLSVVNLMPKADETASEKGLVKIHLVDKDGKVHKTLYYTSVNTGDVTFNQIYDLLKGTYKIERDPQNVKTDTAKKHYVTDKGEFDGHTFEANFVLEAADSLPVEEAQEPKTYAVTELPKHNPLLDAQLVTVKVQDDKQAVSETSHYLVNSETSQSPFDMAAQAFVKAHPDYKVDASQAQQVGQTNPDAKEEVQTNLGTFKVYRSNYVLTAVAAGQAGQAGESGQTSQASQSSQAANSQSKESSAPAASQASGNNQTSGNNQGAAASQSSAASQASSARQSSATSQAPAANQSSAASQSSATSQATKESKEPGVRYDRNGRRLPSTGEASSILSLFIIGLLIVSGIWIAYTEHRKQSR
ncbi:LPXTG cell wall anchor domain-containing protein [uncultured Abiotrophia sp.]|uniref:LPXTG cell wall anchor domain-containing protein n=1 Tax=uncultured Abiotrophia sp. TaxID=316094 RepID=UPI00288AEDE6|nr:LPXTG cell wall anchor domain-containing protein [uncultured Abiotrophia sp.]